MLTLRHIRHTPPVERFAAAGATLTLPRHKAFFAVDIDGYAADVLPAMLMFLMPRAAPPRDAACCQFSLRLPLLLPSCHFTMLLRCSFYDSASLL